MSREERWQLSGNAAEFYEQYVRLLMEPWVHCLVDVAALQTAERVLDVASGTGFVARLAAERVGVRGRVVGLDLNAGMIEAARAASGRDGTTIVEWRTGDAAALPFEDSIFDVVLCQQGVQFFPDRIRALREMRRVLRPEGRLAFTVWSAIGDTPYLAALTDALLRHLGAAADSMARVPYALSDARELHDLVASAGFRNVHVRPTIRTTNLPFPAEFVPGHLAALPISPEIARLPPEQRNAHVEEVTEALSAFIDRGQLIFPAGVQVVTADA
jgi:ubiquinone/menaquinone biosynthesis C-methylase UbiE